MARCFAGIKGSGKADLLFQVKNIIMFSMKCSLAVSMTFDLLCK